MPCWRADDTPENRAGSNDVDRVQDEPWPFGVASEEAQLRSALGDDGFQPMSLHGKAGTMVLYDISLFHTRSDPAMSDGRTRRTMHTYVSRSSVAPLTDWYISPPRLAADPYYARNKNKIQQHFEVRCNISLRRCPKPSVT